MLVVHAFQEHRLCDYVNSTEHTKLAISAPLSDYELKEKKVVS